MQRSLFSQSEALHGDYLNKNRVIWIIGRGASIACGLDWVVPNDLKKEDRQAQINFITLELQKEQKAIESSDATPVLELISFLAQKTNKEYEHFFLTTNWDTILDNAIDKTIDFTSSAEWNSSGKSKPSWLANSLVFHLNGRINIPENANPHFLSPFLLETDSIINRTFKPEANIAIHHAFWEKFFVVIGVSFECSIDRNFLTTLFSGVHEMHGNNTKWVIVNPDEEVCRGIEKNIKDLFPQAIISIVNQDLQAWIKSGMAEICLCFIK